MGGSRSHPLARLSREEVGVSLMHEKGGGERGGLSDGSLVRFEPSLDSSNSIKP